MLIRDCGQKTVRNDAAYVELSRKLKCSFVTADRKLYEKVRSIKSVDFL